MDVSRDLTGILHLAQAGDKEAVDRIFEVVYDELHCLAKGQRMRWGGNHTVNTTVLVHEAYLKLVNQERAAWEDRSHFFAVAATAMRHILINYAEKKKAARRGGGVEPVPLEEGILMTDEAADEVLALNVALSRLQERNERQARVVEMRFFVGFTTEETGAALGISTATVKRDWQIASAWLQREIKAGLQ